MEPSSSSSSIVALGKRRAERGRREWSREEESSSFSSTITASAAPWLDAGKVTMNRTTPRMTRSHDGFDLAIRGNEKDTAHHKSTARPLGGTNKRLLMQQIRDLQEQVKELQQRLSTAQRGIPEKSFPLRADDGEARGPSNSSLLVSTSHHKASATDDPAKPKQRDEDPVSFPSTFASSYHDPSSQEGGYLEEVVSLAGRMRRALLREAGGASAISGEEDFDSSLITSNLRQMLLEATPHPEYADSYASAFASRSLELYKDPKDRSSIMQPGPLQKNAMHPQYIDILMQCIREPVIAHTGSFDQLEFCIWLVTEVTYHTEDLDDSNITDQDDLDDSRYEFSGKFFDRYPFIGTRQVLEHTNHWRAVRGEPLIVQTEEMIQAEAFTQSQQKRSTSQEKQGDSMTDKTSG